ncbi:RHS repeat-associated core domain-containing protein, partial [Citrobacter sp. S2-9]
RSERYQFAASDDNAREPDCPWRFAGQWADEESGLYYNRFRYYDVETGQYLSPDPMGLVGGLNSYGYVANPLKYIDPLGLCKETGGRQVLDPDSLSGWERAESMYDLIRLDPNDVALISKNTGWKESIIARVKEHLFFKEHILDRGLSRFDADPGIVNAWERLKTGDYLPSDIDLLRHEQFESRFEGIFGSDYRVSHDAAVRSGRGWE